ncbi:MAG: hypothetical protein Q8O92_06175 [Candidatus Latescibacter sp.]|nr:hypothetical protein [Candidatus Latescibacter sp.]
MPLSNRREEISPACWITLWEYGRGTLASLAGTAKYDRGKWKQ